MGMGMDERRNRSKMPMRLYGNRFGYFTALQGVFNLTVPRSFEEYVHSGYVRIADCNAGGVLVT